MIHVETDRYAGVPDFEGWWDVPVAEVSERARRCGGARELRARRVAGSGAYLAPPMSELLVHAAREPRRDGTIVERHARVGGLELRRLRGAARSPPGADRARATPATASSASSSSPARDVRSDARRVARARRAARAPFEGAPDAAYLPPGIERDRARRRGGASRALLGAGAGRRRRRARRCPPPRSSGDARPRRAWSARSTPILMGGRDGRARCWSARCITPAGHWSSYPPHKHDRDALPRGDAARGDLLPPDRPGARLRRSSASTPTTARSTRRSSLATATRVLVPRGYHTVSAPPGYDLYYLNVMAGPTPRVAVRQRPRPRMDA